MNNTESIKYLYPHEKTALFRALEADQSAHCLRNRDIFYLAEYCGMRASEVGLVRLSDINLPAKEIHVHRLKKSNCNTLRIIDANVFDALRIYYIQMLQLTSSNPNQILFPSQKGTPISRKTLDELMKKYCQIAGLPDEKAHFHALKHTRAITLAEAGADTKEIQYWLGHKSIKNTEIYYQFTTSQYEALYRKLEKK